ncbi:MAG: hypothetical protein Q7J80_12865 [Anaerolineales bacterium]|nr:hypothetical protein [Anaerolineales bacterium]
MTKIRKIIRSHNSKPIPVDHAVRPPSFLGYRPRMAALMLLADTIGFATAGAILYIFNMWVKLFVFQWADLRYISVTIVCLILYSFTKLYPGIGINPAEEIKLVVINTSAGFLIGLLTVELKSKLDPNLWAFIPFGLFSMTFVLAMRWFVRVLAAQANLWGEPVAVLARGPQIERLTRYFLERHRLGFVPVLAATDSQDKKAITRPLTVLVLRRLLATDFQRPRLKNIDTVLVDTSFFGHKIRGASYSKLFSMFRHVIFVSDLGWVDGASLTVHDFEGLAGMI